MKLFAIIVIAFSLVIGGDKPQSRVAVNAQRAYEDSISSADEDLRESQTMAENEYLKSLKKASAVALESKDLTGANEIEAAIKAIPRGKPFVQPTTQLAIQARRDYEDALRRADQSYLNDLQEAEKSFLLKMGTALDRAAASKDLKEANAIDASIKEVQQRIEKRENPSDHLSDSTDFKVDTWASGLGDIRGVTVGSGAGFGADPFVFSVTQRSILRVTGKNSVQTLARGFKANRSGRIVFSREGSTSSFGGDMLVVSPADHSREADLIFKVTADGRVTLFHSGPKSMAKGASFGSGTAFGDYLYAINVGERSLWRVDSTSTGTKFGSEVTAGSWEDDMIMTSNAMFGENAYVTDGIRGKLLRMSTDGKVTDFATIPGALSIAEGQGVFGEFLYVGTFDGTVVRVSPDGETKTILSGFGSHKPEGNFRGIDIADDQMWLTTDTGELLKVTFEPE